MKTSRKMQQIIENLAQKHGMDLTASEAHLRLEQECYMPLVIEKIGKNLVSVAHYYEQNGDLVPDPDVLFYQCDTGWYPIEITTGWYGTRTYAELVDEAARRFKVNTEMQHDLAQFCNDWGTNILEQGWLKDGRKKPDSQEQAGPGEDEKEVA